ncbi:MAG: hypothetical protein A2033_15240 [Bacteroidetes bacterium GWA2_31_9]|nr:MAG: hypothetical protein A2033_15240 [Bacteroidetes bacterium GWA2_31_9]
MYCEANYFSGLLFSCPYKNELETCAFKEIRKIDLDKRIEYFLNTDLEEHRDLITKHLNCQNKNDYKIINDCD